MSGPSRLVFHNWPGYVAHSVLGAFSEETGIGVSYETYASNDELAQRLKGTSSPRAGDRMESSFDLIVPSENFVRRFLELGLLQPVDAGNRYTIPWAAGTTGIGYDTTVFDEPPDWSVFMDAKYRGKMTVLDEIRDAYAASLFSLGLDPNTTSPDEIDAGTDRLIEMRAVIRGFDSATYADGLANGDLVAAHAYSGDVLQAKGNNPKLGFVLPEAGALRWVDSLAVAKGAPNFANALAFMNFYLEPEISAKNANVIQYDTANPAAMPLLDPAVRDNPVIFPPADVLDRLSFTAALGADVEKLYADGWSRVQGA